MDTIKKVSSETYSHEFHFLSENEVFFDRHQAYGPNHSEVDVYADFWSFLFADVPENGIRLSHHGQNTEISGKIGILIPPHEVMRWQVRAPRLHWFAYSNNQKYPADFPKALTIYRLDHLPEEASPQWIHQVIQGHAQGWTPQSLAPNLYAKKLKEILDFEYKENKSLSLYASDLGISKEWLIKYFKKSYDVTPIEYRNKKRLMQTLFALHTEKNKIVNFSQNVGFNDLKQFNALFKKVIRVTPSQFLT